MTMLIFDGKTLRPATVEEEADIQAFQTQASTPPIDYSGQKLTVVQRLTDAEAETVLPAMATMPAKLRLIWDTAAEIRTDSPFFGDLKTFLSNLLPADRADELLARETT